MVGADPRRLAELSDAAIFFEAWQRFGERALEYIVGDFAFAIWSGASHRLVMGRDPTGQRPLFYSEHATGIAFASMPFGLLACAELRTGFDSLALANALLELPRKSDQYYLKGVRRVLPGHLVTYQDGVHASSRYWSPVVEFDRARTLDENVEEYRDLIDKAVRSRLERSDGPIACHLSSGLDSNAVTATAARLKGLNDELLAFTAAPREGFQTALPRMKIGDEAPLAALAAQAYGARHIVIRPQGSALAHVHGQAALYQEPKRNVVNAGWIAAIDREASRLGAQTLLSGDLGNLGANAGNISQLADFVRLGDWSRWFGEAAAARRADFRWRNILFTSFGWRLPNSVYSLVRRLYLHERSSADLSFAQRELVDACEGAAQSSKATGDSYRDRLDFLTALDFGTERKGALAETGLDVRDPTADRRLIEFSFRVPPDQLFRDGIPRRLAREALADRVPEVILRSKVRGHQAADWFEHVSPFEVSCMIEEISVSSTAREVIDFGRLKAAVDQWPDRSFHRSDILARFSGFIPVTLATGYFILEAEKRMREAPAITSRA